LSLARNAFFENHHYAIDHRFDELNTTIGEELLRPTSIYVGEALEILDNVSGLKALVNITSDGLLNLARVNANIGYVIDHLIEPQPIFSLIQRHAEIDETEMFEVFNMGIGFCYVVDPRDAELTISILAKHGRTAQRIGYAVADNDKIVRIPERSIAGRHKKFWKEKQAARRAG
jgi:phosphoribosylformylglycinamidine cyclo-ligase